MNAGSLAVVLFAAVPANAQSASTKAASTEGVVVNNVAFAVDISSLMPVGVSDAFDASVQRVYFWNRVSVKDPPARIKHVWYHDGKNVAEFVLTLRHQRTRVWTYKKVRPGSWKVEITDESGEPITVTAFIVKQQEKRL